MGASWIQTSFIGGEWSKSAQGRVDDPMYKKAMNLCRNALPIVEGSNARRPGFRKSALTRGGLPAKLLNYVEDRVDYEAELTDSFARFFQAGQLQTLTQFSVSSISAANPAVLTTTTDTDWATGDYVRFIPQDVATRAALGALANRAFIVDVLTTTTFHFRNPVTLALIDGTSLGWDSSFSLNVAKVREVVTPYTADLVPGVNIVESDKRAVLLHASVQPQVLTLDDCVDLTFTDGPYLDPIGDLQITPDAKSGIVNLVLSFPAYDATKSYGVGDYVTSSSIGYRSLVDLNENKTPASNPTYWTPALPAELINGGQGFGPGDAGRHVRLFSEPALWNTATTYSAGNVVAFGGLYWTALAGMTGATPSGDDINPNQPGVKSTTWAPNADAGKWTWGKITATSVDTAIPGIIDPTTGTNIGSMTSGGGLAAAFDGNLFQTSGACAWAGQTGNGTYVGKQLAVASTISSAKVYPSTDRGFFINNESITIQLYAKHTAPGSLTDGTVLGTVTFSDGTAAQTIISSDTTTAWEYVWARIKPPTSGACYCAELQLYSVTSAAGAGVAVELIGDNLLYTSAIRTWRLGLYNDVEPCWPTCGVYHEGRFWLAGAKPGRFDASTSNNFDNAGNTETVLDFSPTKDDGTVTDGNAISYTLNSEDASNFIWMKSDLQGILVGTEKSELLIHASDNTNILTPTSIQAQETTAFGTKNAQPAKCPLSSVFVHKSGEAIFEYFIAAYTRRPVALEISLLSRHLTKEGVEELAYTSTWNPTVWYRTSKGNLRAITYRRTDLMANAPPDFTAAHRHDHGGGRLFTGVCPAVSHDGLKDTLAVVTKDPITGLHYVEHMTNLPGEDIDIFNSQYLDGAMIPAAATATSGGSGVTLTGLDAYEGITVDVMLAGLDCGSIVVSGGSVVVPYASDPDGILSYRYLTQLQGLQGDYGDINVPLNGGDYIPALVGFSYTSQGQRLRPLSVEETGSQNGPALGKLRRQNTWSALFLNTRGISIGTVFDSPWLKPVSFRKKNNSALSPTELYSGVMYATLEEDTNLDSMTCWEISRPYPATIVALGGFITVSDK